MVTLRIAAAAVGLFLVVVTTSRGDHAEADPGPGYDFSAVTALVQSTVTNTPLTGAGLLLYKDGAPVYEQYFGSYNSSTIVPIASSTKWISASVFMTLVDDGIIGLDDPVSMYLPEWAGAMGAITMRQLWAFTSGLPGDHPCLGDQSMTLAQCVEQIRLGGLIAPPGTQFYYGGASMQVAGRVAEVATGQSWLTLYYNRIKTPLGMTSTGFGLVPNPQVAGGMGGTMREYGNLLKMLLGQGLYNGEQVLSPSVVTEMQKDQTFGVPIAYTPHPDSRRYGLGEWRDIVDGATAIQVSSQGKFGFSPWLDNQRGYVGVFMVNDLLGNVYLPVAQVQALVRGILDTYDSDLDGQADGVDADDDNDGVSDSVETSCGSRTLLASSRAEWIDGPFTDTDDDGDTLIDEALPVAASGSDCDGDGFTGAVELAVYASLQGDQDPCGTAPDAFPFNTPLGWAADLKGGAVSNNKVTLQDVTSFVAPVRYFNSNVGASPGDQRWDIVPGKNGMVFEINLQDLTRLVTLYPPMLNGPRAFNGPVCPWP